jgi:hypothetical protein
LRDSEKKKQDMNIKRGTIWEKGGGCEKIIKSKYGQNMFYIYVWKCHNETCYLVQLTYDNKNEKEENLNVA